jgi:uncharacterized repeat protein (TIGR02543 family)
MSGFFVELNSKLPKVAFKASCLSSGILLTLVKFHRMRKIVFALIAIVFLSTCKKKDNNQMSTSGQSASAPASFTVKYYVNGGWGTVPVDGKSYHKGDTIKVLDGSNLIKSGCTFLGWNLDSLGTGVNYLTGNKIVNPGANFKLYANWYCPVVNPASENSSMNCGGSGWSNPTCSSSGSLTLKGIWGSTEVALIFNAIPTTGTYNVSSVSGPSNVQVTVLNAPTQPSGIIWYGKTGIVSINATSTSIIASFAGVQCVQANLNFPVVTLNGTVGCY